MFRGLTKNQVSQIMEYRRRGDIQVGFVGLDYNEWPVLWIGDANGTHLVAIRPTDGWPRGCHRPLRDFTEEEVVEMPVEDAELIFSMPYRQPNQPKE